MICRACPRDCGINRRERPGYCGETGELRIASAVIHRGEEPPICGAGGSGAIFITGCNLGCPFCQNHQISRGGLGRAVGPEEFARICLALEERGAENINLVTGSHAAEALVRGIGRARSLGLRIPALWNSSGYEDRKVLDVLQAWIDVYLPDMKTLDRDLSGRFFNAPDYPDYAAGAILRMMELRPLRYRSGALESGVIIRHLALPGFPEATREVLKWFRDNCRGKALLSLMTQYTPMPQRPQDAWRGVPDRHLQESEYRQILDWLEELDIEEGFYQELVIDREWLPDFNRANPFPASSKLDGKEESLALPVWHWREGFLV